MKQALYSIVVWGLVLSSCLQGGANKNISADEVIRRHIQALNEKNKLNAELYLVKDKRNIIDWQFQSQKSIHLISITPITNEALITSYMETGRGSISHPQEIKVYKVELKKVFEPGYMLTEDTNVWNYYVVKQTSSSPWLIDDWGI